MNNIGIIIPTYNEEENIGKLVESIKSFVPNSEIFVVDDSINDLEAAKVNNITFFAYNNVSLKKQTINYIDSFKLFRP